MNLPAGARVRAAPNLLRCLDDARQFMERQDARSAPERYRGLQAALRKAADLLAFSPGSGRPARFLDAASHWGRHQADQALQAAAALGLPELRELTLSRHVLVYAHSDREVVLLALRHERQLAYGWHDPR